MGIASAMLRPESNVYTVEPVTAAPVSAALAAGGPTPNINFEALSEILAGGTP